MGCDGICRGDASSELREYASALVLTILRRAALLLMTLRLKFSKFLQVSEIEQTPVEQDGY